MDLYLDACEKFQVRVKEQSKWQRQIWHVTLTHTVDMRLLLSVNPYHDSFLPFYLYFFCSRPSKSIFFRLFTPFQTVILLAAFPSIP